MGAKKSQVLMITPSGFKHMFDTISDAAKFANANAWTMSLKMQVMGYFEDNKGNKYYRQTEMKTKNDYTTNSPKTTKKIKKHKRTVVNTKKTPVIVDGIRYDSVSEAEVRCGLKRDTLGQALRKNQKTSKGHTIAYAETNAMEGKMPIVDIKPKEEKILILIDSEDPAIKAINKEIVEILKKANVYDEIKSLAKAIQKLSK